MAQVPHVVDHPAQILRDAAADIQGDHPIDQQPAQEPPAPALNNANEDLNVNALLSRIKALEVKQKPSISDLKKNFVQYALRPLNDLINIKPWICLSN